ncbi:hypothetical protein J437_LFUL019283 [Ladona fulva]|uniref:Uncharacterized protein n=1 Tax=Ladona fulva TaxID=123851 RepID=A0A8K0KT98_LADFU|nr:hypothetical protein J437_LFUL019283 [Ladona fulva]
MIKMSLYPSLEDMKVDQLYKAQMNLYANSEQPEVAQIPCTDSNSVTLYPVLNDFMGLELPSEWNGQPLHNATVAVTPPSGIQINAPVSGRSLGLQRAQVTHGIREVRIALRILICSDRF